MLENTHDRMRGESPEKIALITGVCGDIGRAVAYQLKREGYYIVGAVRRNRGEQCRRFDDGDGPHLLVDCDVANSDDVGSLFRHDIFRKKRLDLSVISAGVLLRQATLDIGPHDWNRTVETNLGGAFWTIKGSLSLMTQQSGGTIIIIGSQWGKSGAAEAAAYSASKAGLRALARSIQLEHRNTGVRIMLISPGSVESRMSRTVANCSDCHLIRPHDIARLVAFVAGTSQNVYFEEIMVKSLPYDLSTIP